MIGKIAAPLANCYVSGLDVETKETPTYDNVSTAAKTLRAIGSVA